MSVNNDPSIFFVNFHFTDMSVNYSYLVSDRCKMLGRHKLWSISNTSTYLTTYAEGLVANTWSNGINNYLVAKVSKISWFVLSKTYKDKPESNIPRFIRVRKVTILNGNCMSCSCGRVQAMLLPCDHTDAVFYDMGLEIEPINIHYRWWTVHSYSRNISDCVLEDIERMREKYRHFYDSNHRFLGFPLSDSQMNVIQSSYANTSIDPSLIIISSMGLY